MAHNFNHNNLITSLQCPICMMIMEHHCIPQNLEQHHQQIYHNNNSNANNIPFNQNQFWNHNQFDSHNQPIQFLNQSNPHNQPKQEEIQEKEEENNLKFVLPESMIQRFVENDLKREESKK